MKKLLSLLIFGFIIFSCKKEQTETVANPTKTEDSINAAREKYNDSIKTLNEQNRFEDLSGTRKISYSSDEAAMTGNIDFMKTGRDLYEVSGQAKSGNNTLNITGNIKRVSEKHLNFDGKISQKIGGSNYVRSKKTTFYDEGQGKFWRLQDKVSGDDFIEYIDIKR